MVKNYLVNKEEDLFELVQYNVKFILSFIIITNFIVIFLLKFSIKLKSKFNLFLKIEDNVEIINKKDVLIIIAHPDDEIMFFGPTIKCLLNKNLKIRILCLSNGNFDNLGNVREEEFKQIMKNLKIDDFKILNHEELKDNLYLKWKTELVKSKIEEYLNENNNIDNIGTIITFDEDGITKHPNHISCSEGLLEYLKINKLKIIERNINTFLLDTYGVISQYSLIIPFVFLYFKEFGFFNQNFMFNWRLMRIHKSQFNIWRRVHVVMSSYTYFNTYTKIEFKAS